MSKLKESLDQFFENIKNQEWYQQAQGIYQQLPSEQQSAVKIGFWGITTLGVLYFSWNVVSQASSLKTEYFEKSELYQVVSQATDELRRLKGQNASMNSGMNQDWRTVFASLGSMQGMSPDQTTIVSETKGPAIGVLQESLLEVQAKGLLIRPLTQFLVQIEKTNPPMKIRKMVVDSVLNEGKINAQIFVSGFTAAPTKDTKGDRK